MTLKQALKVSQVLVKLDRSDRRVAACRFDHTATLMRDKATLLITSEKDFLIIDTDTLQPSNTELQSLVSWNYKLIDHLKKRDWYPV